MSYIYTFVQKKKYVTDDHGYVPCVWFKVLLWNVYVTDDHGYERPAFYLKTKK